MEANSNEDVADETWRTDLSTGSSVWILKEGIGSWYEGIVTKRSADDLTVYYIDAGVPRHTTVDVSSTCIRFHDRSRSQATRVAAVPKTLPGVVSSANDLRPPSVAMERGVRTGASSAGCRRAPGKPCQLEACGCCGAGSRGTSTGGGLLPICCSGGAPPPSGAESTGAAVLVPMAPGTMVKIQSASAGGTVEGVVTDAAQEVVRVQYFLSGRSCIKTVGVRDAQPASVAVL